MTYSTWLSISVILLLIILSTYLISRFLKKDQLGPWADIATIVGGFATAISLLVATYTYYASSVLQNKIAAQEIYREHLLLCMEYPEFTNRILLPVKPEITDTSILKMEKYERYQWFVGHSMYSFESILSVYPNDSDWINITNEFIDIHLKYICCDTLSFIAEDYSDKIEELIKYKKGQLKARIDTICKVQ